MWYIIYGCMYIGLFTKHIFGTLLHLHRKMWGGLRKSTMWAQITPSYIFTNIFNSECGIPFLLISEESPLNSTVVTKILLYLCKWFISYDRAKTKNPQFFVLTWLIFAGPVKNVVVSGLIRRSFANFVKSLPRQWIQLRAPNRRYGSEFHSVPAHTL